MRLPTIFSFQHYVFIRNIRGNDLCDVNTFTSLEDKKSSDVYSFKKGDCALYDKKDNSHFVMNRAKYLKLRNGSITPIPYDKTENFDVWSGFQSSKYLYKSNLKN